MEQDRVARKRVKRQNWLREHGITQVAIAEAAGVSEGAVSRLLAGSLRSAPLWAVVHDLARARGLVLPVRLFPARS